MKRRKTLPKHQHLLNIPMDLFDLIDTAAQREGTSRTALILEACRQKLQESPDPQQNRSAWSVTPRWD
jgi:metal-responsive CopG/Arc/MetJ family transcriptional regulator